MFSNNTNNTMWYDIYERYFFTQQTQQLQSVISKTNKEHVLGYMLLELFGTSKETVGCFDTFVVSLDTLTISCTSLTGVSQISHGLESHWKHEISHSLESLKAWDIT